MSSLAPGASKPKRSLARRILRGLLLGSLGLTLLGIVAFFALNATGHLGDVVELFRRVTGEPGTRFVRWAEEIYFETKYDLAVWWNGADGEASAEELPKKASALKVGVHAEELPSEAPTPSSQAAAAGRHPNSEDIPWSPYIHADGAESGIYTAQIFPNDKLPEEPVYLAWEDSSRFAFHWVPGTTEPEGEAKVDRSGKIPERDRASLVAAFNGGYLTKHGTSFGAKFEGVTLIPPKAGLATAAITKDGNLLLGEWGRDFDPKDENIVTFRQNLRLIVDAGEIPPDIWRRGRGAIRPVISVNDPLGGDLKAHTWRSGIGVTKEGDFLFAAGDFLDGALLARALQAAGAERAMQLDVNAPYFCVFLFFEPDGQGGLTDLVLGPKMTPRAGQFLTTRNAKDFAYITRR